MCRCSAVFALLVGVEVTKARINTRRAHQSAYDRKDSLSAVNLRSLNSIFYASEQPVHVKGGLNDSYVVQPKESGSSKKMKRIVNGEVLTEDVPYFCMTLSNVGGIYFRSGCGAVVIGKRHALTAAHCVSNLYKNDRLKQLDALYCNCRSPWEVDDQGFGNAGWNFTIAEVKRVTEHPSRKIGAAQPHDIAVIELAKDLDDFFQPLPIGNPGFFESLRGGQIANAIGIGLESYHAKKLATKTQEASLPLVSNKDCQEAMAGYEIDDGMCCAGGDGHGDTCTGDSGGPLVLKNGTEATLIGLSSWGVECNTKGYPGVFTRVSSYVSWLEQDFKIDGLKIVSIPGEVATKTSAQSNPQQQPCTQNDDHKVRYMKDNEVMKKRCKNVPKNHCSYHMENSSTERVQDHCQVTCEKC